MVQGGSDRYVALGPWVGNSTDGNPFDYRPLGIITQIVIAYRDDRVDAITFKSKTADGLVSSSPEFGSTSSYSKTYTVSFVPGEYIIRLNIEFSARYLSYLLISTNTRVYGPFGSCTGTEVSIPITERSVVGFFGRCGDYIYSLGIYVPNAVFTEANQAVKSWTYLPQGLLTKMLISHGDVIDSLVFESKTSDGVVTSSMRFGGTGGTATEVPINVGEYITGIYSMVGDYSGQKVVNLLTIHTNVKTYGPFGKAKGSMSKISIKKGSMFGFSGHAGIYLNTLDIFEVVHPKSSDQDNEAVKSWTYLPRGLLTKMLISHGDVIDSLVFESKTSDGVVTSSMRFGGTGGTTTEVPIHVGEYITGIDSMVGDYSGQKVVNLLTIHTIVKTYGPFGKAEGSMSKISIKKGSMFGFSGHAGMYLNTLDIFEVVQLKSSDQDNEAVKSWTYLPQGLLTKMLISHGDVIDSLVFESKTSDGVVTSSMRFGGTGGTTTEVPINVGEYITGIDSMIGDYSGEKIVNLLTIHTNVKTYGPFGKAEGSMSKISIKKGSIVGFSGRAGMYLNTFDIFEVVQPKSSDQDNEDMSIGPLGGPEDEGESWTYKPPEGQITQIVIRHGIVINYIVFQGKTSDGSLDFSQRFGRNGGTTTNKISFGPGEYITGIEVMLGDFSGVTVVYNLSIRTNLTNYGPFGTVSGTRISIPITDGRVVGFCGRSATYLNAIGVHAVTNAKSTSPFQENKGPLGGKTWNECIIIGPWGGLEGTFWAYRPTEFITKIVVNYGSCIDSLTFYMTSNDGTVTNSRRFGGPGGSETEDVLISSREYITGVDVMVGQYAGESVITRLSFHTNITSYGPYGSVSGSNISIPIEDGGVVGFFGRSGSFLNAIGIFAIVK